MTDPTPMRIVTCVYCGFHYPSDTPTAFDSVLTEHIRTCPAHPLRAVEADRDRLRAALVGLVGASEPDELREMGRQLHRLPIPPEDKSATLNAISALLPLNSPPV